MDDALSTDERAWFEQMLASDPQVARELEQLKSLRLSLHRISKEDRDIKLPRDFAQSVLEATVARGRLEGLSDEHPVMRMAEEPSVEVGRRAVTATLPSQSPHSLGKVLLPIAALAASIAIAVIALREQPVRDQFSSDPIASIDQKHSNSLANDTKLPPDAPESREVVASLGKEDKESSAQSIGAKPNLTELAVDVPSNRSIETGSDTVNSDTVKPSMDLPRDANSKDVNPKDIAASVPVDNTESPASPTAIANKPNSTANVYPIKAVLVLNVQRTMDGLDSHPVETAMKQSGLDAASRKKVDEKVVRFANSDGAENHSSATVLYLEAPAKRLDQFINRLVGDEQGIESVSFSIADDLLLVGMIESLRKIDPTKVKHDASWQLDAGAEGTRALSNHLTGREFANVNKATAEIGLATSVSASETPDIVGHIIVVIR